MKYWVTGAAVIAGIILGFLGGPVRILFTWTAVSILLGYFSGDRRQAVINGALFGFFASFFFMVHGYNGTATLISRTPFFALLGVFGGVCGFVLGAIGFYLHRFFQKKSNLA